MVRFRILFLYTLKFYKSLMDLEVKYYNLLRRVFIKPVIG